ncbi:MAG: SDR family NAD(P)-dependent oxidoreductase [Betaproteobacteria bacterium]
MGKTLLVAGAGSGLGRAVAQRFAAEGYTVALAARNADRLQALASQIRDSKPFAGDLTDEASVIDLFDQVEPVDVVAFIAAARVQGPIAELKAEDFEKVWRQSAFSGFLVGREAARRMLPRKAGTVIFTGASASLRGRPNFAAFTAAKGALRQMAQSMAKELGPQGIHVAHVVIDGAIDSERMRKQFPQRMAQLGADGALHPDAIAEAFWQLHCQPRSAWTHEIDLRPAAEPF